MECNGWTHDHFASLSLSSCLCYSIKIIQIWSFREDDERKQSISPQENIINQAISTKPSSHGSVNIEVEFDIPDLTEDNKRMSNFV